MLVSPPASPRMGAGIMTRIIRAQTLRLARDLPHTPPLSSPAVPTGPHFAEEKTEAQGSEATCPKFARAARGRAGI